MVEGGRVDHAHHFNHVRTVCEKISQRIQPYSHWYIPMITLPTLFDIVTYFTRLVLQ